MATLQPISEKTAEEIREMLPEEFQEKLNKTLIMQAFLVSKDKNGIPRFYVNRTGLLIFMEKKFRQKKARYSIRTEFLSSEEEKRIKEMLRIPQNEPFVAMRGIVEITYEDGTKEVFEDIGTASPRDCHHNRLVEMAATRATNRAMRLATSLGFTSVEELPEEPENTPKSNKKVYDAETIDPDTPFEELPKHVQVKILVETDKLFKRIANIEANKRGEDVTKEQIKQEMLEEFGVDSRKQMTYQQLQELWKKAKKRLEELEQEQLKELTNELFQPPAS